MLRIPKVLLRGGDGPSSGWPNNENDGAMTEADQSYIRPVLVGTRYSIVGKLQSMVSNVRRCFGPLLVAAEYEVSFDTTSNGRRPKVISLALNGRGYVRVTKKRDRWNGCSKSCQ